MQVTMPMPLPEVDELNTMPMEFDTTIRTFSTTAIEAAARRIDLPLIRLAPVQVEHIDNPRTTMYAMFM
jgi:hypothetical protein